MGSTHRAFFMVRVDDPAERLDDLRGRIFGCNSLLSNSGRNLPRLSLARTVGRKTADRHGAARVDVCPTLTKDVLKIASMMPLRLITGYILPNPARVRKNAYASSALARSRGLTQGVEDAFGGFLVWGDCFIYGIAKPSQQSFGEVETRWRQQVRLEPLFLSFYVQGRH